MCASLRSDMTSTLLIGYRLIRSRTGWKPTDALLTRVIVLGLESQLPPTSKRSPLPAKPVNGG